MADDTKTWLKHSLNLALFTAFFHVLQFSAAILLWTQTSSAALISFGLDAAVSAFASLILALRIRGAEVRSRLVAYGYFAVAGAALYFGASMLWLGQRPARSLLGIALAAVSMLVIPIVGSYMKTLAVELRNQMLKAAAIFTFGNSYLSMVLLISLLMNAGMDLAVGDLLGALVMVPFIAQKGVQILLEEGKQEYAAE